MGTLNIPEGSLKFVELLIEKNKEAGIISPKDMEDINRLEKKRKEIWERYRVFEEGGRASRSTSRLYQDTKNKFLRDMDEIDLEVAIRKNENVKKKNRAKRMRAIETVLSFATNDAVLDEDDEYTFDALFYSFAKIVQKDAIEELRKDYNIDFCLYSFNERHKNITVNNKYYLSEDEMDDLVDKMRERVDFIADIKNTVLDRNDFVSENFKLIKMFGDDSFTVYKDIKNDTLKKTFVK